MTNNEPHVALKGLKEALLNTRALPVLFIGAGLSRRYLGTPAWDGLLRHLATLTGADFDYYRGRANQDRPKIASLIAADFYRVWFESPHYADSREAFKGQVNTPSDPLKYEVAKYISRHSEVSDPSLRAELTSLGSIRAHAIITTNWDTLIESHLPDLDVFVGQQDVLFSTTQAIGEVYKIHGSVTDPQSLILTSEDYAEYWDRNPYLIAKLLTMLVEHPVLFIGYGLGDAHINRMLSNLIKCLDHSQAAILNDRLFFVRRPEAGEAGGLQRGSITVGDYTLNISEYVCSDFLELFQMLSNLPERFPAKLLRRLRESVYELTFSTEPSARVHVLPMDGADLEDVEIVVGVGTMERLGEKGYRAIGRTDLFRDMLDHKTDHATERLLLDVLPRILRTAKFAPVFYPLFLADKIDSCGIPDVPSEMPPNGLKLATRATKLAPYTPGKTRRRREQRFAELAAEGDDIAIQNYGLVCRYEISDVVALRTYLREKLPVTDPVSTPLAKLACKYDLLTYGPGFDGDRAALHAALTITAPRRQWSRP